ncbi:glutamate-5-semialdehyde dehydrogenase [Demequina sp. TTPB684]|uniref:glutamate-5-semialdehyde dehydrogenase n=1 Tax=unclassified Demequina TaxID=2620311 RepID=UPI001CF4EF25|nr:MULTISPECIES: glutamate-5-semialdehyde dehydrogenase [unclassified Demequina]MCB2412037.1 glutamate-5-semialdehyde dehydrogenase [Demequina sp. TTPB684]UPU88850.1 glutamate-5-semialdehyde dehydrogenase [Demequina sp. TMPB413]
MTDTVISPDVEAAVLEACQRAKVASRALATATRITKDAALHAMADGLVADAARIVAANAKDVDRERDGGMSPGLLDRLTLTEERITTIAEALRFLASLPDPVGEIRRGSTLPNGLRLTQKAVPMGVVGMIYEARPNVTVDAAGLALKSGNAAVLRGGSAAAESNEVIVAVLQDALESVGLPRDCVQSIDAYGREGARVLMHARGLVDVLVPRGGRGLIQTVVKESTVPAIETGEGNCHVYLDASAPLERSINIVINSKTHRVGVCNAAETLLVHKDAEDKLPAVLAALHASGVTLHVDDAAASLAPDNVPTVPAMEEDWETEYLSMDLAVKVVDDIDEAIAHIRRYSTGHTEAIVTDDINAAEHFVSHLDSAAVMVNASTRFTDGGEFGLGAEIGISTQKLHARGPMGLAELTTTTWVVYGDGHVRG